MESGNKTESLDRVFTDADTKLYRFEAEVAIIGSKGYPMAISVLPVKDEEDKTIGYASVEVRKNKLIASCTLDYHTPERLLIETGEKLYLQPTWIFTDYPKNGYVLEQITIVQGEPVPQWPLEPIGKPVL